MVMVQARWQDGGCCVTVAVVVVGVAAEAAAT